MTMIDVDATEKAAHEACPDVGHQARLRKIIHDDGNPCRLELTLHTAIRALRSAAYSAGMKEGMALVAAERAVSRSLAAKENP